MTKGQSILIYGTLTILSTYFLFLGLVKAQAFLVPMVIAVILALLMVPLARRMELFLNKAVASLVNVIIILLLALGFMALISYQVKSFTDDWPEIKKTMQPKVEQFKDFVSENTPFQMQGESDGKSKVPFVGSIGNPAKIVASFFTSIFGFLAKFLLTLIYIFFFLNYRGHFKKFLLRLFPDERRQEVKDVIRKSAHMVQQYILGKLLMTGILLVFYAIGLGLSGVNNFIVISAIAALLNLIPYIGNIVGLGMALAFGYLTSGNSATLIGIMITFALAQFIESYILEPYVVGDKVKLHPFFVILAVIIGNMVWGISGMILAIPILAILNVILLHVPSLHPFGYLFSQDKTSE